MDAINMGMSLMSVDANWQKVVKSPGVQQPPGSSFFTGNEKTIKYNSVIIGKIWYTV